MKRFALLAGLMLLLGACGSASSNPPTPDTPPDDSGRDERPGSDSGTPDAGAPDAGTSGEDAGRDAGTADSGTPDSGTPDSGTPDAGPTKPLPPDWPALQTSIPEYRLTVAPEHLQALNDNIENRDYEVPASFAADGRTYAVDLSYRGRSTRYEVKKPWQVHFDKADRFQGVKRIELLAAYKDGGYLTEKLWYDTAASVGLEVPRVRYVHLYLNGRYEGVYVEVESITKDFLAAHGLDDDGDIYRCGMHDCELRPPPKQPYMEDWEKKTNEKEPWDRLWTFLDGLNRTPPDRFEAFARKNVELDDYITWMVLDAFIVNHTHQDARSYLVYSRETGRWTFVPWDLNNALSLYNRTTPHTNQGVKKDYPHPGFSGYDRKVYELYVHRRDDLGYTDMRPTWSTLTTRILKDPKLRAQYIRRMRELLDTRLTEEQLGARIDAMHALLAPFILPDGGGHVADPYVSPAHAAESANYLRRFVRERRAWLLAHLDALEKRGQGPLVIDRVGRGASGAWWVQLYNRGSEPVKLDGLRLSADTRVPFAPQLSPQTLAPGAYVTFGLPVDPARTEAGLFDAAGMMALDLWWFAPLAPGEAYGREPRGAESFRSQPGP
ncbi:CotH kinase family protein [Pyxidicoccus sp. MSG2]|uniref:CotH kinase family protein n=1 Tax=Pyxidicoccus sp. MSG2 TaxID=2996790 RepID=UPI00226ED51C|nr:CotH kinase family protein [Pyxidicoccus sp. MSG2]MCY1019741.1 CotH kinase family protein [Pyxidicoccus sp. MSG2]